MTCTFEIKNELIVFDDKNDKLISDIKNASHMTFFKLYSTFENVV